MPETFELCTELIRPGGRVANVGVHGKCATLHLEKLWIRDVMITTGLVDTTTTPKLMRLIEGGRLDPTVFATHHFALARDRGGVRRVRRRGRDARAQGRAHGDAGRSESRHGRAGARWRLASRPHEQFEREPVTGSCCFATARASGTSRASSPAGSTSGSPSAACTRPCTPASCSRRADLLPDVVHTSLLVARDPHDRARARGGRPRVDPRAPLLAPERAALRRRSRARARSRRGSSTATSSTCSGAAPTTFRRRRCRRLGARGRTRPALRRRAARRAAGAPSASRTCSSACSRTGTTRSSPISSTGGSVLVVRARQLAACARQAPRRDPRRRDRRAQPPDRRAARLRARRSDAADGGGRPAVRCERHLPRPRRGTSSIAGVKNQGQTAAMTAVKNR